MLPQQASVRDQAIIDLLRLYRDLEGVSSSGIGGDTGSPDRLLYMGGGQWDKSGCDDLDEALKTLRVERPSQWWHVTERYLRCEVRPRRVKAQRTNSGKLRMPSLGPHTEALGAGTRPTDAWTTTEILVVVEVWRPEVRLEKTRRGIAFLTARFPWDKHRWRDLQHAVAV